MLLYVEPAMQAAGAAVTARVNAHPAAAHADPKAGSAGGGVTQCADQHMQMLVAACNMALRLGWHVSHAHSCRPRTCGAIQDKQGLVRGSCHALGQSCLAALQLLHQLVVVVEPPRGVTQQHIHACLLGLHTINRHGHAEGTEDELCAAGLAGAAVQQRTQHCQLDDASWSCLPASRTSS